MRKLIKRYLLGSSVSLPNTLNVGFNLEALTAKIPRVATKLPGISSLSFSKLLGIFGQKFDKFDNNGLLSMGSNLILSFLPQRITSNGVDAANSILGIAENIPIVDKYATLIKLGLNTIDSLGASKLATLNKNQDTEDALARTGGGYGDFMADWDEASALSGQNAGLFTPKGSLNNKIWDANRLMSILLQIMGNQKNNELLTALMGDRWNERTMMDMNGGIGNISFGQKGIKITRKNVATAKRVSSTVNKKPSFELWYKTIPTDKNDTIDYDLKRAYAELPFALLEKFRTDPNAHLDGRFKKPTHPTYDENLDEDYRGLYGWFGSDVTGWSFHPSPRLLRLRTTPEKDGVQWYKEYWDLFEPESTLVIGEHGKQPIWSYNRSPLKLSEFDTNPNSIEVPNSLYVKKPIIFEKEGGKMNVIPEGSLHARLHHMENAEGLTKKGIPVVSIAEGGELEQLAEIELNEIIFRLEVTQELEKLMKDGSDNAAIEAGKLLVKEIFENTDDRTGLLKLLEPEKKEPTTEEIVKNHQVF